MLNVAEDHLDWHGSMAAYAAAKAAGAGRPGGGGRARRPGRGRAAATRAGAAVRVGFRLGEPAAGELGVRDGDAGRPRLRATTAGAGRRSTSIPVAGPVGVLDALAAAALARAVGVPRRGRSPTALASFRVGPAPRRGGRRRSTASATSTTPRPPTRTPREASMLAYPRVVWIAGGLLKGASVDELVAAGRPTGWSARC